MKRADRFHAHLEKCERCRTQPFNLCANGEKLLLASADDLAPPHTESHTMAEKKEGPA